jgi:hypothetical protein
MSRILPRFYREQQAAEDAARLAQVLLETGEPVPPKTTSSVTLAGDTRRLRGLPAVARGVAGVSPGTDPVAEVLRSDRSAG